MALFEQIVSSVGLIVVTILLGLTIKRRDRGLSLIYISVGWFLFAAAFALETFIGENYITLALIGLGLVLAIVFSLHIMAYKPNKVEK